MKYLELFFYGSMFALGFMGFRKDEDDSMIDMDDPSNNTEQAEQGNSVTDAPIDITEVEACVTIANVCSSLLKFSDEVIVYLYNKGEFNTKAETDINAQTNFSSFTCP